MQLTNALICGRPPPYDVLPPPYRKPIGRSKKKRRNDANEEPKRAKAYV